MEGPNRGLKPHRGQGNGGDGDRRWWPVFADVGSPPRRRTSGSRLLDFGRPSRRTSKVCRRTEKPEAQNTFALLRRSRPPRDPPPRVRLRIIGGLGRSAERLAATDIAPNELVPGLSPKTAPLVMAQLSGCLDWLGGRDSNPDSMVQSHVSYRWTTSQRGGERSV